MKINKGGVYCVEIYEYDTFIGLLPELNKVINEWFSENGNIEDFVFCQCMKYEQDNEYDVVFEKKDKEEDFINFIVNNNFEIVEVNEEQD
jgi:hypothetical protein